MNIIREKKIGSGAYGEVYSVIDKNNTNHKVALKIMDYDDKVEIHKSTIREFNCMQLLKHPNLVNTDPLVYTDGTQHSVFIHNDKKTVDLTMELLHGDLKSLSNDKLTSDVLNKMVGDVTKGLYHMHSMGFIHNDLKPENILYKCVDGVYTFKIGDFGISQYLGIPAPSKCKDFLCTYTVKAPDTRVDKKNYINGNKYNYNSDMFSLGATMFWMYIKYNRLKWNDFIEDKGFLDIRKKPFLGQVSNLKKLYGDDGFDFLIKCMETKSSKRMSSKKGLEHPYITKRRPSNQSGGKKSFFFNQISKMYKEPTIQEITNSSYELEYLEDMYNLYKDKYVNLYVDLDKVTGRPSVKARINWIYSVFNKLKFDTLEIFLQYQLNVPNLMNRAKDINNDNFSSYNLNLFRICEKLYGNMAQSNVVLKDYSTFNSGS